MQGNDPVNPHGCRQERSPPGIEEWGNQFANFNCKHFATSPCCNLTSSSYAQAPTTRAEALQRMRDYFVCRQHEEVVAESQSGLVPDGFHALNGCVFPLPKTLTRSLA